MPEKNQKIELILKIEFHELYEKVTRLIEHIEIIRDHIRPLTVEEIELHEYLNKLWDQIRENPFYSDSFILGKGL